MLEFDVAKLPIRLIAADIDGTLLNPEFQISTLILPPSPRALRRN